MLRLQPIHDSLYIPWSKDLVSHSSRTDPTATTLPGSAFLAGPYTKAMYENGVLQPISYKKPIYMLHKTHNSAKSTQSSEVQPGLQTSPHLLREGLAKHYQTEDDFQCIRQPPRKYITFMYKLLRHFRGAYYNKKGSSHPSNCTSLSHSHSPALESMRKNDADVYGCEQL